ncbi:MAG: hypothetical protein ACRDRS_10575 [Pseudonocardiaceae bacterium]
MLAHEIVEDLIAALAEFEAVAAALEATAHPAIAPARAATPTSESHRCLRPLVDG